MNAIALDDLRPRKPDRLTRGAMLAILAHALLVVALTLGVSWRTSEPAGVEAELWAAVPQAAAPRAVEPEPPKPLPPQVQPQIKPQIKPQPEPKPTPKVEPPPPNRDADIAREKREQKDKLEKQRLDDEKREADKKKQQKAEERQRDEQAAKLEADKKKKAEAERATKQTEAQRQENLKRILGQAGATGAPTDTGTAAQSAGPSASYAGRIKARIKPNIVFADDVAGNPVATVEVKVAPDGTITSRRLVKSSGASAWDDAVIRAIDRTETLPRDTDGRVPPTMVIEFRTRDF